MLYLEDPPEKLCATLQICRRIIAESSTNYLYDYLTTEIGAPQSIRQAFPVYDTVSWYSVLSFVRIEITGVDVHQG